MELVFEHAVLKCGAILEKSAVSITHNAVHILSDKRYICESYVYWTVHHLDS